MPDSLILALCDWCADHVHHSGAWPVDFVAEDYLDYRWTQDEYMPVLRRRAPSLVAALDHYITLQETRND